MANTGSAFLQLSKSETIGISRHALRRLEEHCGAPFSTAEAFDLFLRGRQVSVQEMLMLGYRPAYGTRCRQGQRSWYFRILVGGEEFIAVVGQSLGEPQPTWVTTYSRTCQTDRLALAAFDQLAWKV
jgi:hypothetical protein